MNRKMKNILAIILVASAGCVSTPPTSVEKLATPMTAMLEDEADRKSYSGGWGYSAADAVVISAKSERDGVKLERPFLWIRSEAEVAEFARKSGKKASDGMPTTVVTKQQSLRNVGGKKYDVQEFEVYTEFDDGTCLTYDTECWFDITGFYGKF